MVLQSNVPFCVEMLSFISRSSVSLQIKSHTSKQPKTESFWNLTTAPTPPPPMGAPMSFINRTLSFLIKIIRNYLSFVLSPKSFILCQLSHLASLHYQFGNRAGLVIFQPLLLPVLSPASRIVSIVLTDCLIST